eukprot:TRINITY_DN3789_c1_g1_i1.p1 TRINITY_DN3789_c1_g1~~TRINITY_DN3789_c1_g1_i1.p1  ORF type:complete len:1109 (+),score=301.27 TRINITY_DN3789_c1_g1_i1:78-3329(+)
MPPSPPRQNTPPRPLPASGSAALPGGAAAGRRNTPPRKRNSPPRMSPSPASPADAGHCAVRVAVRVRPALPREISDGKFTSCVAVGPTCDRGQAIFVSNKGTGPVVVGADGGSSQGVSEFTYDYVFGSDADQSTVYGAAVEELVGSVLDGFDATVFAYGQTGTGKTHTMQGDGTGAGRGVAPRAVEALFARLGMGAAAAPPRDDDLLADDDGSPSGSPGGPAAVIHVACLQIYREVVTDLLGGPGAAVRPLSLRQGPGGHVVVSGLTEHEVSSPGEVEQLLRTAQGRRSTAATELNAVSSRSHLVLQVMVTTYSPEGLGRRGTLNLVDLAGSERVRDSGVTGDRMKEAQAINKSLFCLAGVVQVLTDSRAGHVPYRDSKLTWLLSGSLGGYCRTLLIATVSPSQEAAAESLSTLRFAAACKRIENAVRRNDYVDSPLVPPRKKGKAHVEVPWKGQTDPGVEDMVQTALGPIAVLRGNGAAADAPVVFLLHGNPSSSNEWRSWFPALAWGNLRAIAIDQPGWGRSPGQQHRCRSEHNLDEGGPVDVIIAVMRALSVSSAHFIGYDWGGGIALSMALKHPGKVKSVVSVLPSYMEREKGELKALKPKVMIEWVKEDRMHNWKTWGPLAKTIPKVTIELITFPKFTLDMGRDVYASHPTLGQRVTAPVVRFLTGRDPLQRVAAVFVAPEEEAETTTGARITVVQNVTLAAGLSEDELRKLYERPPDGAQQAVARFEEVYTAKSLTGMLRDAALGQHVALFSSLPPLDAGVIGDGDGLVALGVWPRAPRGRDALGAAPRYWAGRNVLARVQGVNPHFRDAEYYMCLDPGCGGRSFVTHRAVLAECAPAAAQWAVRVPQKGGGEQTVAVPREELLALNQPQEFRTDHKGRLELEDGLRCSYESSLVRAKLLHIAFALRPIVAQLDFSGEAEQTWRLQRDALRIMRRCLDLTTFADGLDRRRIGRTDDVGKMACYGQGQCHGCSSTMAAFMLPFCAALGIDLRYRGGWTFGEGHDRSKEQSVADEPELHQWLEVTLRPSGVVLVVDLFLDLVAVPADPVYSGMMYPNGKLILGCTPAPLRQADVRADQA